MRILLLLALTSPADPFDAGSLSLAGRTPEEWGVPRWRALVTYVHQVGGPLTATTRLLLPVQWRPLHARLVA